MTEQTTYNGYTNYETWVCNLWIDNDEELQEMFYSEAICLRESDTAIIELADIIKEHFEDGDPLAEVASFYGDLLTAAFEKINYMEIARNIVESVQEEANARRGTDRR